MHTLPQSFRIAAVLSRFIKSWQRAWRLMPSRAASVQIKIRSGSVAGSGIEAPLELFALIGRGRAGEAGDAILRVEVVQRFQQSSFEPAARVLVFREEEQASVGPLAASRHILPNPCGQLHDAGIRPTRMPARDLQHLVNEGLVTNACVNCLGRAEIAAEFARQKVNVIVTYGGAVTTLKQATAVIPIVFAIAIDPIGSGLVANLSRPGGNVTGLSLQATDIASKRLDLLREAVPRLRQLGILFDAGYPAAVRETGEVQSAARALGLEVAPHEIRRAEDIAPVFEALKSQADALYVVDNALVFANRTQISTLALSARLPTIFPTSEFVKPGGLMSYGPSYPALFRRAADFVDKILRGTKPGDIPVEQPTMFELVINLTTATALGLEVPHNLLVLADEVIE